MTAKREQLTNLHDRPSVVSRRCICGINKIIQPLHYLPGCLQYILMGTIAPVFFHPILDELFVSYHLISMSRNSE